MKLLIVSDSHGDRRALERTVNAEPDAAAVIFLGDGTRDAEALQDARPALRLYLVRGNCDFASFAPTVALAPFGGALFFYTHGHLYDVKSGLDGLARAAAERGASAALFGHTHRPALEQRGGVTLFNPGALSSQRGRGEYGVALVEDGRVTFEHRRLCQ